MLTLVVKKKKCVFPTIFWRAHLVRKLWINLPETGANF